MKLYKLINPTRINDEEIDTNRINYGFGIEYHSEENKALITFFNAVINDSFLDNITFNDIFRETYQPETGRQSVLFWETLYERSRKTYFPEKPSRLDSYFAFSTEADVEKFRLRSHRMHKLKTFETNRCNVVHIGDMEHLDQIVPTMTANEAAVKTHHYWQGTTTENPLLEYLVQGKLSLQDPN